METLTIREISLGAYTQSVQDAVLAGYKMSDEPSKYPWNDTQFNAVFELSSEEDNTEQPNKPPAGRPRRIVK